MRIEFKTSNAAFGNTLEETGYECCSILESIIQKIMNFETSGNILDSNGSEIGTWDIEPDEEKIKGTILEETENPDQY